MNADGFWPSHVTIEANEKRIRVYIFHKNHGRGYYNVTLPSLLRIARLMPAIALAEQCARGERE